MTLPSKENNLQVIVDCGVVAVIRANDSSQLLDITRAVSAGGVKAIEITMTVPNAIEGIEKVVAELGGRRCCRRWYCS